MDVNKHLVCTSVIRPKRRTSRRSERQLQNSTQDQSNYECEKILNSTDKNVFLSTADIFVEMLNKLEFNDEVFDKLSEVHNEIQRKLLSFKCSNQENYLRATSNLKNFDSNLASSNLSICSVTSITPMLSDGDEPFEEFLRKVNCPFCSEPQADKFNLIDHLFKSCEPFINNKFEEINIISFSAFQILSNNTIKCNICQDSVLRNLKQYFIHKQTPAHMSQYVKRAQVKKYTEFLFCSCCKVLVPNNYTQLEFHMKHEIHKTRSACEVSSDYSNKGISCVYLKRKQFKCLNCPINFKCQGPKNILLHFETKKHKQHEKVGKLPKVFCEFCNEDVHVYEVIIHFTSNSHMAKEKAGPLEDWFELCYYCGFRCNSLKELSLHMKSQCTKINNIRKNNLPSNDFNKKNLLKTNSTDQMKRKSFLTENNSSTEETNSKGNTTKDCQPHIIVKDNTDVVEVYRYFKKFGEITNVGIYQEKNVLLQFREKSAVEDALLLRDVIQINGMKVDIIIDESSIKPNNLTEKSEKDDSLKESLNRSGESESGSDSSEDVEPSVTDRKFESLMERVSNHLSNITETFDPGMEDVILCDCDEIFGPQKCSFTGFFGCRLSFPVEVINIYCNILEEFSKNLKKETYSALMGSLNYQIRVVKEYHSRFCDSVKWTEVSCTFDTTFPQIECKHTATGKSCKFIFSKTATLLMDMLSQCINEVKAVERFCLIVRFWFNVNELKIKNFEFAIMSLLIFFLTKEAVGIPFLDLQTLPNNALSFYVTVQEKFGRLMSRTITSFNITQMFRKFLTFLLRFDFQKNLIYLPCNSPIPRNILEKLPFSSFLEKFDTGQLLNSKSMLIIDPLLSVNLSGEMSENDLKLLLEAAKNTLTSTK